MQLVYSVNAVPLYSQSSKFELPFKDEIFTSGSTFLISCVGEEYFELGREQAKPLSAEMSCHPGEAG